jgi:hypothetical protein
MWLSDKVYLIQRNLVYLSQNPEPEHSRMDTACCVAASIFVHIYLRDLGVYPRVVGIMVEEFRVFLEDTMEDLMWMDVKDDSTEAMKLFWALVIGAIAAYEKPQREWFVDPLRDLCGRLGIEGKSEVLGHVTKILWTKEWDAYLDILWDELSTL